MMVAVFKYSKTVLNQRKRHSLNAKVFALLDMYRTTP